MSSLARTRSVALTVAWRSIHNALTNPAILLPSIMFPLFFFIAFAGGLSNVQNAPNFEYGAGYTAFQFGFVCIQAAAFGGVFTGFAIAADFEFGFARRLLLAAPNRGGIVIGYMLAAMARALLVLAVVFVAGIVSGMDILGSFADMLGLIVLALAVSCDLDAVGGRHRDAAAHDAGRARSCRCRSSSCCSSRRSTCRCR